MPERKGTLLVLVGFADELLPVALAGDTPPERRGTLLVPLGIVEEFLPVANAGETPVAVGTLVLYSPPPRLARHMQ